MKKIIKSFALLFLANGFRISYRLKKISQKNQITILNLHRVSIDDGSAYTPLNPYIFEELIKFCVKNYQIITFTETSNYENENIKKPLLILSFDDGYKDFINVTARILSKYKIKVNQNIIPECIESGIPPLNVLVQDFIGKSKNSDLTKLKIPGFVLPQDLNNRISLGLSVSKFLKNKPIAEQRLIKIQIQQSLGMDLSYYSTPMLNLNDINELINLHEFGAHSFSHANMELETDAYFENDLIQCKNWFINKFNFNVEIYAFPNGSYKVKQIDICKSFGFKYILLVDDGFSNLKSQVCRRFGFHADSEDELKFKCLGGFSNI
jgi:peptidoglycan/xylan/chitin deacetylase (PgdA/CDA1 family)